MMQVKITVPSGEWELTAFDDSDQVVISHAPLQHQGQKSMTIPEGIFRCLVRALQEWEKAE